MNQIESPIKEVKVIRSRRRRKTISARLINRVMVVRAPQHTSQVELEKSITKFRESFERKYLRKELNLKEDLKEVVRKLNKKYFDGKVGLGSISYSPNQSSQFGSCNYRAKTILISHQVATMPRWVRNYVIIHEMAHIIHPNHSRVFWELVNRYRLTERARGYLLAKGFEPESKALDIDNNIPFPCLPAGRGPMALKKD
jgi:hypothetical protein